MRSLKPSDVPCIYCLSPKTHAHGIYERQPYVFGNERELWEIHRRFCPQPVCGRTFGLLPSLLAPYARFVITAQDMAVALLAEGKSVEQTARQLDTHGVSPSESTLCRWMKRMRQQVPAMLPTLSSLLQALAPRQQLPPIRKQVRDPLVCCYYDRLSLLAPVVHSGAWNHLRRIVCLFAPSVSVNRVSYGLLPDI